MVRKVWVTSVLVARKMPGCGLFVTGGNGGTGGCWTVQPAKSFSSLAFMSGSGEIASHCQHDVGGEKIALVKLHQILAADPVDGGVLLAPAIGRVLAVNDIAEFALFDAVGIIVAPRDTTACFRLGQIELVLPESRGRQNVVKDAEDFVGVLL